MLLARLDQSLCASRRVILACSYTRKDTLWLAVSESWTGHWTWTNTNTHAAEFVREFRYDAPRQRYMVRDWDPVVLGTPSTWLIDETSWTDYLGMQPYVDYDVTINGADPVAAEVRRFAAALGIHGEKDVVAQGTPETYYHPDLTGSTTVTTDETGSQSARTAYTAFGELVDSNGAVGYDPTVAPPTRYQYDGGWGYESGLLVLYGANPSLPPITLQHVGARWYQPGIGRFVQRDPIGLNGGLNVYVYCGNAPTARIDASGEGWHVFLGAVVGAVIGGAIGGWHGGWQGAAAGAIGGAATGALATAGMPITGGAIGSGATALLGTRRPHPFRVCISMVVGAVPGALGVGAKYAGQPLEGAVIGINGHLWGGIAGHDFWY